MTRIRESIKRTVPHRTSTSASTMVGVEWDRHVAGRRREPDRHARSSSGFSSCCRRSCGKGNILRFLTFLVTFVAALWINHKGANIGKIDASMQASQNNNRDEGVGDGSPTLQSVGRGRDSTDEEESLSNRGLDVERCREIIRNTTLPYLKRKGVPTMLSRQRLENVRDKMMELSLQQDPVIPGDWVETGTWKGGASLLAAVVQRTAQNTPECGNVPKRTIWLADSFEGLPQEAAKENKADGGFSKPMDGPGSYKIQGGVETVKRLFVEHGFGTDGSGDVPIRFLEGWFEDTLPDAPIEDIAILRLDGDLYASTLQALFALYRRVPVGGTVIIDDYGHWPQCKAAIDDFFLDANVTLNYVDYTGRWFQKENDRIRVPPKWNKNMITIDPKVLKAWQRLSGWHRETTRNFVGHVGTNRFQTYRYIEAMRHVIQKKRRDQANTPRASRAPVHVHVCETGFNGGHSAMLFLAFHNASSTNGNDNSEHGGVHVHYHGWDLGKVGSSRPIAKKMEDEFGAEYFHVVWGDSKQTLPSIHVNEGEEAGMMHGQTCDIIVVDGDHSSKGVANDLRWLLEVAHPGTVAFGDDCAPYSRNVPKSVQMLKAWLDFVDQGKLVSVARYRNPQLPSPGFVEAVVPNTATGT